MEVVKFNQLQDRLASLPSDRGTVPGQVILIFGENFLMEKALEKVVRSILPDENETFVKESFQGGSVGMSQIIEEVMTLSFLAPQKLVIVKQAPLFNLNKMPGQIGFEKQDLERLTEILEKGMPEQHFLIFTTPTADKRKKIFKAILKKGMVIDCSVSQGARKADQDEQQAVLKSVADQILSKHGKKIDRSAFQMVIENTGFNLDVLAQNMEKLIHFSGSNDLISLSDVKAVVKRDKKDPIFNLTNSFMDKNVQSCLFYFHSLIKEGYHLLQILKSFENLIRKMLNVKCAALEIAKENRFNYGTMNFNAFKTTVMPKIIAHDQKIKEADKKFTDVFSASEGKTASKKQAANDLLLAPNPKNPYPVFQTFLKTHTFSLNELSAAMIFLSDLDYRMKSSSIDAKSALEQFIIQSCSKGGFSYAAKNQNHRYHF